MTYPNVERFAGAFGDAGKKRRRTKAKLHQYLSCTIGRDNGCNGTPEEVENAGCLGLRERKADITGMDSTT